MKPPYLVSFLLAGLLILLTLVFRNYEFLLYAVTVAALAVLLFQTDRYFAFAPAGLWMFNAWLVLHILGGLASWDGVRFYDLILLPLIAEPYHLLKYDQSYEEATGSVVTFASMAFFD